MNNTRSFSALRKKYPPRDSESLRKDIVRALRRHRIKVVVLDDDPTGIQTVHGNYLLTNWQPENLRKAFADDIPFFYLLTNTRAMTPEQAGHTVSEAVQAVLDANESFGFRLVFVSRSDSTLRGHFPLEPEMMRAVIEKRGIPVDLPVFFIPAFFEAGRYTVDGTHFMRDGERLIPVSDTEFARDNVFGYSHSDLKAYIEEKSGGKVKAEEIGRIALDQLYDSSLAGIEQHIRNQPEKNYITVDAFDYYDLRLFSLAFLTAFGRTSASYAVLRTSSSLPKALSGIPDQELPGFGTNKTGGLFIVGSHVKKSTAQLRKLLETPGIAGLEADIDQILNSPDTLLDSIEKKLQEIHEQGLTPVVYTSRKELRSDSVAERQLIGQNISNFLVDIVRHLPFQPAWLVAKGGITSHDILTKGLEIERARVLGQILPGIPVIRTGTDHRFPGMPYLIFPGNVGSEEGLKEVFEKCQ